jgi:drug/metabolite transporter (DMT)-like permease
VHHAGVSSRAIALAVVALCNVLWAGSYVAGKAALDQVSFATLNALRLTVAAAVLAPLVIRNRHLLPRTRADRAALAAIALFSFCGNKALEFLGLSLTTATDTALLITSESLVTVALAVLFLGERLRRDIAAAVVIGGVGVYVIVERGFVAPHLPRGTAAVGDALVVASLVLESIATIAGARLMTHSRSPITLTGAAIVLSLVVWVPTGVGVAIHEGPPRLDLAGWAGVVYLALVTTVVAYSGWYWALQRLSAQEVTPFLLLQPVAGTLIAAVVRGARPGPAAVAGGILVLVGVALAAFGGRRRAIEPVRGVVPEAP